MQAEFAGVKFTGGRLFVVLTALSTLAGGIYSVNEAILRYKAMEAKIAKFVSPDLSGINQAIAVLETDSKALTQVVTEQVNSLKETVSLLQGSVFDVKLELKQDLSDMNDRLETQISRQSDNLDQQEIRNRDNVKTVRDIISSFETRMNSKIDFLDTKIDNLETELDEKIKLNLSNPLTQ